LPIEFLAKPLPVTVMTWPLVRPVEGVRVMVPVAAEADVAVLNATRDPPVAMSNPAATVSAGTRGLRRASQERVELTAGLLSAVASTQTLFS
jgi:hypothetical protein